MGILSMARRNPKDLLGYLIAVAVGYFAARLAPGPSSAAYIYILVSYHVFLAWVVFLSDDDTGLSMPIGSTIMTHLACAFLVVAATMARHYIPFFGLLRFGIIAIAGFERNWLFTVSRRAPGDEGPVEVDLLKPLQAPPLARVSSTINLAQAQVPKYSPSPAPAVNAAQPATQLQPATQPAPAPPQANGGPLLPTYAPLVQPVPAESAETVQAGQSKQGGLPATGLRRKPTKEAGRVTPILNASAQDHEDWLRERARMNPTHRKPGITVREEYEEWLKERFRVRAVKAARKANAGAR